jgi:LCP family protein required for cell wall assembly
VRRKSTMFASVNRARRPRGRTVVRGALVVVAALVVLALVLAFALWRYASSRIDEVSVPVLEENRTATDAPQDEIPGTLNVLVVGSDSREGLTDQELEELGTEDIGTNLTDTIMLVQVSPVRDKAVIVSFPRDLRVDPPGEVGPVKINSVQARGGADLLIRTIQDLTGVPVDHYVQVDIKGFLDLTNAIGGVEICLDEALVDVYAGVDLPAGCRVLDGRQAAGFVRARRTPTEQFGADDFGRIAKQQYFISQAMDKVTSAGTLLNPLKVKRLIDAVGSAVTTDRELSVTQMYRLANTLRNFTSEDLESRVVPSYWSNETGFTHMYVEQAEALFQSLRDGSDLGDVGTSTPEDLEPSDVRVLVVNGVGTEGLAREVSDYLTSRDFEVVDALNPQDLDPDTTWDPGLEGLTIGYLPAAEAQAQLLANHLGDLPVELVVLDPVRGYEGADVILTVGSAWSAG